MKTILDLSTGEKATVTHLKSGDLLVRQRLLAMGFVPGATFEVHRIAPLGDPIELKLGNACLSLRKKEAQVLEVEPL